MSFSIIKRIAIICLPLFCCLSGLGQSPACDTNYSYRLPPQLNDGLAVGSLKDAGIDSAKIIKLTKLILSDTFTNIHSLLILRNNKLVYENYFAGKDEIWGLKLGYVKHDIHSLHDVRSISKSVVSACVGIAIQQQLIKSIDDPIFDYLPDYIKYKTADNGKVTIRQLLTMSSGIKWDEDSPHGGSENDETHLEKSSDPVAYPLSLPMAGKPGATWNYNSGGVQVLAHILKNASGYDVDVFAERFLFAPLGITDFQWIKIHNKIPAAASGLRLRSRDLAKFGLLYLNKGKYNYQQVLPERWVKASFSTAITRDTTTTSMGYGYLFWTYVDTVDRKPRRIVSARGNGGERIFFDEGSKLIVVITAGNYNNNGIVNDGQVALDKYILPAVK